MFVKICGITRAADAVAVAEAGADAVGLNFVPASRRRIDVELAREIVAVVPDQVLVVGVFQGHSVVEIHDLVGELGLGAAQLHGDEPASFTREVAAGVGTVIKAVTAGNASLRTIADHGADVVMLDAPHPGGGVPFDWGLVGELACDHRILLAGGLHPGNVADAIRAVQPWGIDVASGVESAPGDKDHRAIARFVAAARAAGPAR